MSAEATTLTVIASESTVVTISDSTVLTASSATITLPTLINLSDSIPLELSDTGSAGTSTLAARSDHRHPSTGMTITGGNF